MNRAQLQAGLSLRAHELEFFPCMNMISAEATGFHIKPNKTPGGLTFAFQKNVICAFNTEVPWLLSEEAHQRATVRLKKTFLHLITRCFFMCNVSSWVPLCISMAFFCCCLATVPESGCCKTDPSNPTNTIGSSEAVSSVVLETFKKTPILCMVGATTLGPS